MKKKKIANQVASITVPPEILQKIDEYCSINYIPRTSFFVKAAKEFLDKHAELINLDSNVTDYSSAIFTKLQYDDLKKVHIESVIPVCDLDYEKNKRFNSRDELVFYRNNQDLKPISKEKATEELTKYYATLDTESCELAYKLTKQAEDAEKKNELLWNSLRQLK